MSYPTPSPASTVDNVHILKSYYMLIPISNTQAYLVRAQSRDETIVHESLSNELAQVSPAATSFVQQMINYNRMKGNIRTFQQIKKEVSLQHI